MITKSVNLDNTLEFFDEVKRMCDNNRRCITCPIHNELKPCKAFIVDCPHEAIEAVRKWSDENPPKTMRDRFFELFPTAPKDGHGNPYSCAKHLGFIPDTSCPYTNCTECWGKPYKGSV